MNKKGFTLIELLSTIFVLGIVLVIATSSTIGIYKHIKQKALDEKIAIIEESAILFGENRKEEIIKSIANYKGSPCKSYKLSELTPNYIENDTGKECISESNKNDIGCIIDPSNKNNYLDEIEVIVYYQNKRIYSVVDINDELECENINNYLEIKEFYIEDGTKENVSNKNVKVTITWENENIKKYCVTNEQSSDNCIWHKVNGKIATTNHELISGDGEKIIYAYIMDKYNNISNRKEVKIKLDTTPPIGTIVINDGAMYTNKLNVLLQIEKKSDDIEEMCISNTNDENCINWESFATSKNWTFSNNANERKYVYVKFKDKAGNISEFTDDSIILDTIPPVVYVSIGPGRKYVDNRNIYLNVSRSERLIGWFISENKDEVIKYSIDEYSVEPALNAYVILSNPDGEKTLYMKFEDLANNESEIVELTVTLDRTIPIGSVSINSGAQYTNSTNVELTLEAQDDITHVTEMCISNTSSCTNWISYKAIKEWIIDDKTSSYVYVQYKDAAGNISNIYKDMITIDKTPPDGSILIKGGAISTSSENVTLTLSSTGATEMCISNTTSCTNWIDYAASYNWTLKSGTDGATNTVYVTYKDAAGNISDRYNDTIKIDKTAPTSNSVSINSGATYATSTSVTLTLSSTGATEMCISNTTSCSSWETYTTSKSWTLTTGDGTKTVYATFKDAAGNISTRVNDKIKLDTTKPSGTIKINGMDTTTSSRNVTLTLSSTHTDVTQMCISNTTSCSNWETYTTSKSWTLTTGDGTKTVYATFKDAAGNVSSRISDTIKLSTIVTFGKHLIATKPTGLNTTTAAANMYRFVGSTANNYVSIGGVLYKVIGVTTSADSVLGLNAYQVKVMKATGMNILYGGGYEHGWLESNAYSYLNSENILGNSNVIPNEWVSKISSINWHIGSIPGTDLKNGATVLSYERAKTTTSKSKVGLMYLSDVFYAYNIEGTQNCYISPYCISWMRDYNNYQWTMVNYDSYNAWMFTQSGRVVQHQKNNVGGAWKMHPTFYLVESVAYVSGSGMASDPFIIS